MDSTEYSNTRLSSIDFFKAPAMLAVICIHTLPFGGAAFSDTRYAFLMLLINQIARCGVPFFFMVSGFFFGRKILSGAPPCRRALDNSKKLLTLLAFWSLVYLIVPTDIGALSQFGLLKVTYWKIKWIVENPVTFLFRGAKVHLWFLVSLGLALWIIALLVTLKRESKILPIAAILYGFGLLAGSYSTTPWGLSFTFNTRNGPFFSTLFVALGWYFSLKQVLVRSSTALTIAALGLITQMAETFFLNKFFHVPPMHNYLIGTVLYGAGVMLFLLSNRDYGSNGLLQRLGPYTLGIYATHLIFLELLRPVGTNLHSSLWEICFPFIVFGCSLMLTVLLSETRHLRFAVVSGGNPSLREFMLRIRGRKSQPTMNH